jgi:hypothetical protein
MYVTPANFMYRSNFPALQDPAIENAVIYVEGFWSGVYGLWSTLNPPQATAKRRLLENLLVAWYLADSNPKSLSGVYSNGGAVLSSKTIGGTKGVSLTLKPKDIQPGMEILDTNYFGGQALALMLTAPERWGIYGNFGPGLPNGTGGGMGM